MNAQAWVESNVARWQKPSHQSEVALTGPAYVEVTSAKFPCNWRLYEKSSPPHTHVVSRVLNMSARPLRSPCSMQLMQGWPRKASLSLHHADPFFQSQQGVGIKTAKPSGAHPPRAPLNHREISSSKATSELPSGGLKGNHSERSFTTL